MNHVTNKEVYLSLGSNLGDRTATLSAAVQLIHERAAVEPPELLRVSSLYETAPVGGPPNQGPYLNAALALHTACSPLVLLDLTQRIEAELGRVRSDAGAPRTLDIDLLLFNEEVISTPRLIIPHPRLHRRRFVLVPLVEIAPEFIHPQRGKPLRELLAALPDAPGTVVRFAPPGWWRQAILALPPDQPPLP